MDEFGTVEIAGNKKGKEKNEILSKSIRSGKRTYFFDLKASRKNEPYLTITESKRRFNEENGTFFYEKHKIFLLKEDMQNFYTQLGKMIEYVAANPQCAVIAEDENTAKSQ
jgi:hypothetical protein